MPTFIDIIATKTTNPFLPQLHYDVEWCFYFVFYKQWLLHIQIFGVATNLVEINTQVKAANKDRSIP